MSRTWGGRFSKQSNPLLSKFNNSLHFTHTLYKYDIFGSIAHTNMLAKQGLLGIDEAKTIIKGLENIERKFENNEVYLDPAYEDIHMLIEHLLIEEIGDAGKKLHTGRSRNDQVAVDMRLYCKDVYTKTSELLQNLIDCLRTLSTKHENDSMPGYTHLQQAQPIKLGTYFGAYEGMFKRDLSRLLDWKKRMNFSPLGAAALAGTTLPIDRQFTSDLLGFDGIIENTLDAVSDRDYLIEFINLASISMMHLSRLCEDTIIWSTQEFNYVTIDDSFATGSSIMPNKKNPDVPELIRGKSGRVFGSATTLLTVMKGLPLAYNKDMQEDKECFFDTVTTFNSCLEIAEPYLYSLTFNLDRMEKAANSGFLGATELLDKLVMKGIPLRDAHHQVGMIVLDATNKGMELKQYLETEYNPLS